MPSLRSLTTKLTTKKIGPESTNNLLKIILISSLILFGFSLFIFKFEILSSLSLREQARLESARSLKVFLENPLDPIHGTLQWLSLKVFPSHQIFALRLPGVIMILSSISAIAIALYLKFRNRYLPYTFLLLAVTSPWLILISHNGHIPGIDILFLLSLILANFYIITSSNLQESYKKIRVIKLSILLGLLLLQPLGFVYLLAILFVFKNNSILVDYVKNIPKKTKVVSVSLFVSPILILIGLLYLNIESWKIFSGFELLKDPAQVLKNLLYSLRSIFGISQTEGLSLGTGRPDLLFTGALLLTIYEIFKKRVGRKELIITFIFSIAVSALYGAPTSIVLAVPSMLAIISLSLANMIRIIDLAFPRNPYPRNIARTGMLGLICTVAILGIYTTTSATIRENTPAKIDQIEQKRIN
jgi:hypothetical protein